MLCRDQRAALHTHGSRQIKGKGAATPSESPYKKPGAPACRVFRLSVSA